MSDGNVGLPPKWKRKLTLTLDTTDALTDPIPEDEEDREDHSEASSSDQKEKVASHRMEDDIESQRALSGNGASTSSIEPTKGKPEDDGDTKEKVSTVIEGEVQISDRPKTDDDIESQQHSDYARRDGQMGVTQKETPSCSYSNDPSLGDTGSSETSTCKKERSSWEYKADDSFKFESGAISEPDKPPGPQPILAPPFVRNKNDFRAKLMHLSDLTLPPSPSGPEPELPELPPLDNDQEQSPIDSVVGDLPLLTSRKKPPRPNFGRPKTRLQDPPPITPAVSDQLASIWSEPASRSRRSSLIHQPVDDDGQTARFGPVTSRRVSISMKDSEADQLGMRRKSVILNAADSGTGPAPAPPAAAPSRLGMFSPSVLFSPSRLGLLSKSKANIQPPPVEEEVDPLDDDSIPKYKKYKKQERRWLVWIQWIGLFLLIVILILAIKLHALQMVMWKQIMLWQWLALALVIVSGRLIAGWCVMILVALIERHYILKKRVLYFVYGLRHAVKNCVWLALVIGVWKLVFRHVESKANVPIVTKVLWCLFTTSCLWMVKILAVKVAANSFHRAAYFDRVQDCLFHQYVLETLSAPRADDSHWELDSGRSQLTELPPEPPASSAPNPVLEPQRSPDKQREPTANLASGTSRTNLGIPSPSTSNLNNIASPSRSNLGQRVPSRANLGGALPRPQASQLMSPGGRRRRVSILNTGTDGTQLLARSPLPIEQEKLQELTSETVSAWTLKKLMKMIRKTNIATFSSILDQEAGERIDSEAQAKAASKQIFYNIARPGERFLTLNDFLYFLPEDQATRAFGLFEVNDLGHITKKALMKWVVNIYKERRALALTLSDNRTVVAKLHRVLDVLLLAVAVTICLLIMGVNTQKLIVGFSSVLLPAVFVFGNAARSTFESLIFLFVMHPFDVGDRINVDGIAMIVEEMNILNTIFLSGSNEKIYYPNSILATKAISNYYRSPDQWDSIEFQIHASTAVEQLGLLKERMTKYIESLPQFWYPVFRIVCKDIEDSTRMKMALWVQHHLNYQESGERWQRRSNMILHMKTQLQDLGIGYHLPRQEITVTGVPVLDVPPPHHCYPTPI